MARLAPETGGQRVAFYAKGATSGLHNTPGDRVLFSADGKRLVFGLGSWTQGLVVFDLAAGDVFNQLRHL